MSWPPERSAAKSKRPDLHPGDALLEQAVRELVPAVQEGIEILIWALGAPGGQAPVFGQLADVPAHVAIARAGVVDADAGAREAAQELVNRLVRGLAEDVPNRNVERREAAHLGAAPGEADVSVQERVCRSIASGSWPSRRGALVDVGDRGGRPEERPCEPDQRGVDMDMHLNRLEHSAS
jgi:hypothetical protein